MHDPRWESYERTVVPHIPYLRTYALGLTRDADAADDLVQATCLRAMLAYESFRPGTNARAWTATILRNIFFSERRAQKSRWDSARRVVLDLEVDRGLQVIGGTLATRTDAAELADEADRVGSFLRDIPARYSGVLELHIEGYQYREIARELRIPVGTVMSRLHRARRHAAHLWSKRGPQSRHPSGTSGSHRGPAAGARRPEGGRPAPHLQADGSSSAGNDSRSARARASVC